MNNFNALQEKLELNKNWPLPYMFKFIVPAQIEKVAMVEALFDKNATIYHKESKTGKYVSITAKQSMESASTIIDVYRKASSIENVVAL